MSNLLKGLPPMAGIAGGAAGWVLGGFPLAKELAAFGGMFGFKAAMMLKADKLADDAAENANDAMKILVRKVEKIADNISTVFVGGYAGYGAMKLAFYTSEKYKVICSSMLERADCMFYQATSVVLCSATMVMAYETVKFVKLMMKPKPE